MASRSTAFAPTLRSIHHLLRCRTAATAGRSLIGVSQPVNPAAEDPASAVAVSTAFSGRSLDMALFGRVDWPVTMADTVCYKLGGKSDLEDFGSDDWDEDEDEDENSDEDLVDEEDNMDDESCEDDVAEKKKKGNSRR